MAYKIIVSPRAQKEIENAIDYYALYNVNVPANFSHHMQFHQDASGRKALCSRIALRGKGGSPRKYRLLRLG